jgi:hypothetical protein
MARRTVLAAPPSVKIGIWLFLFAFSLLGFADNGVVGRAFAAEEDRIGTNGLEPEAARFLPVRGFYMPSYDVNGLVGGATEKQLNALRAQVPSASHAVLAVHVRVPGGTRSNTVVRDTVSENPGHLVPWFDLAKKKGLRTGLLVILFSDGDWNWGGYWKPSNPTAALASYYSAIRPYVQAAQAAKVDFVILCDEWSTLYYSYPDSAVVPAFRALVNKSACRLQRQDRHQRQQARGNLRESRHSGADRLRRCDRVCPPVEHQSPILRGHGQQSDRA